MGSVTGSVMGSVIRAQRTAVRVPGAPVPLDTAHVTLRYPALPATTDVERMSGVLPADPAGAPYPVVVLVPGVNVAAESYRWLALRLAEVGLVAVTFDWVTELFPGQVGLSPGVALDAVTPDSYGSKPSTPALQPILAALAELDGPLAGLLDLDRVALVGHSAGGTVALQSAGPDWFPTVRAVATFGAHTMASQQLGWAPDTLLTAPVQVPVMLVGGTADGVVAASAIRYGHDAAAPGHDPLHRTWDEALPKAPVAWLVRLAGAGHMLPVVPDDPSSARGFLEPPTGVDQDHLREVFTELLTTFLIAELVPSASATAALENLIDQPRPEYAEIRRR